jgi:hypothetical protein
MTNSAGTLVCAPSLSAEQRQGVQDMRSVLLWLLGVPISVIILLNVFNVI